MNYYQILELNNNATQDEIKASYKKLIAIHHPDRGGDEEMMKQINEAYTILSDPQQKSIYDENIQPSSFLKKMFNMATKINISLETLYQGGNVMFIHKGKEYSFDISPRTKNNHIVLRGENKFMFVGAQHPVFKVHNNKLILNINITVGEMLGGFIRTYKFLDGKTISFVQPVGKVTKNETKLLFPNFGLEANKPLYIFITVTSYPKDNFLNKEIKDYKELKEVLGFDDSHKLCNRSIDLSKLPVYEEEMNGCNQQ
jgi:DnaJ-class molecular chaperone